MTDSLSVGGSLEIDLEGEYNFDLDDGSNEDVVSLEPTLSLSAAFEPNSHLRAFVEFELSHDFLLKNPNDKNVDTALELTEAYIAFPEALQGTTLTLGRMRFRDEREWLMDEELDGVQLVVRNDQFAVEAAATREELLQKDLLGEHDDNEANNFYLRGFWALGDDSQASTYALLRDGRKKDAADNLLFIGTQSFGSLTSSIDYWGELAMVTGEEERSNSSGFRRRFRGRRTSGRTADFALQLRLVLLSAVAMMETERTRLFVRPVFKTTRPNSMV